MNKVSWTIFIAAVVLIIGGLAVYSRIMNPAIDVSGVDASNSVAANEHNGQIADHVYGKADSKVVFIEYGDFQCPGCGAAHKQIQPAMEAYKDKVAFIFRNFPLTSIHPNALVAAATAEAAGLQGKYWEMHDKLYDAQQDWSTLSGEQRTNVFVNYATELGLDTAKFKVDVASRAVKNKISFDQAIAKKIGVEATPSMYINGEKLSDTDAGQITQGSLTTLTGLFDKALAK